MVELVYVTQGGSLVLPYQERELFDEGFFSEVHLVEIGSFKDELGFKFVVG